MNFRIDVYIEHRGNERINSYVTSNNQHLLDALKVILSETPYLEVTRIEIRKTPVKVME